MAIIFCRSTCQLVIFFLVLATTYVNVLVILHHKIWIKSTWNAGIEPATVDIAKQQSISNVVGSGRENTIVRNLADDGNNELTVTSYETATVIGMATGYDLPVYKLFVGSLRKSGFNGHIILGVSQKQVDDPKIREYFTYRNVTPKVIQLTSCTFTTFDNVPNKKSENEYCAAPYEHIKMRWSRFPLARDWIESCPTCIGPVLFTDVRDVYFQKNPFGPGLKPIKGLQVFEEHQNQTTKHWITSVPLKQCKNVSIDKPMLCSGTTVGTRDAMLMYLTQMYDEMQIWAKLSACELEMNGDDQAIHNYLYYIGKLPYATAIPMRSGGIVNTVGYEGARLFKTLLETLRAQGKANKAGSTPYPGSDINTWIGVDYNVTDKFGYFTEGDGSRSRVIHQFDRYGQYLSRWIRTRDIADR